MMRACLSIRSISGVTYLLLLICCHGNARDIHVGVVHTGNQECHLAEVTASAQELNNSQDSDTIVSVVPVEMNDSACALDQAIQQHSHQALILLAPLPPPCFCGGSERPPLPPLTVRTYQAGPAEPTLRSRVLDMFPSPDHLATMLIDVMEAYGWKSAYVLYNKQSEFYRCIEAMENIVTTRRWYTWFREVPAKVATQADRDSMDAILSDVRTSGRIHVVMMTDDDVIDAILEQAFHRMLLTSQSHWIITSFDASKKQLDSFRHSGARFTLLRQYPESATKTIPNWSDPMLTVGNQSAPHLNRSEETPNRSDPERTGETPSATELDRFELGGPGKNLSRLDRCKDPLSNTARLARDSVAVLADLLSSLEEQDTNRPSEGWRTLENCSRQNQGSKVTFRGASGDVSFDDCGRRIDVTIYIREYSDGQEKQVGFWTADGAVDMNSTISYVQMNGLLGGRHLQVFGRLSKPWIMERKHADAEGQRGRYRYEGFMLDLTDMLAARLNFTWNLTMGANYKGAIKSGEYDLVLFPMSMRPHRLKTMQLSIPLRTRGYFLTMKKSDRRLPGMFQFMAPFSKKVWLCFVAAIVSVSLVLSVNNRFNPNEWGIAAARGAVAQDQADNLNLPNSLWSTWGAAVGQGPEFLPRSYAGRVAAGTWWFFVLVAIASYTANLAAFLSQSSAQQQIKTLSDLAEQTDVPYGTYDGYSIVEFFQQSQEEPFKTLGKYLTKNADEVLVTANSRQAMDRAIEGNYIFISPTTYEYEILKERCDMVILTAEYFFKYQVALPFPLESPYVSEVNLALMKMAQDGEMDVLENRWFNKKKDHCKSDAAGATGVLGMDNFGGLFYFLVMGMGGAMAVFFVEWIWFMFRPPGDGSISSYSETNKNNKNNNASAV
ncbi:GRIA1 [Branchiostoma lanceolatum]|uniref:GRIA1 protein n=1 Tax=Branchiostoma lanceolatum TaxID=7740 RepID=A0A8J9YXL8_BRALA|nr:GRIA1 [Branchiostoma lanceolatum]